CIGFFERGANAFADAFDQQTPEPVGDWLASADATIITQLLSCNNATNPDHYFKWQATREQAMQATDVAEVDGAPAYTGFTGVRGFEWTNDYYNHMNVYFSTNVVNVKVDGSYASMDVMWNWLRRPVAQGGGADALATFNHPGGNPHLSPFDGGAPTGDVLQAAKGGANWNDLAYVPDVDDKVAGIEVNGGDDIEWYIKALTRGWHLGPVAAEDEHQREWATSTDGKTLILTRGRSPQDYYFAFRNHRTVAIRHDLVNGAPGSQVQVPQIHYWADGTNVQSGTPLGSIIRAPGAHVLHVGFAGLPPGYKVALLSNRTNGQAAPEQLGVVDGTGAFSAMRGLTAPTSGEDWYFVAICPANEDNCGGNQNYSAVTAPIWFGPGSTQTAFDICVGDVCLSQLPVLGPLLLTALNEADNTLDTLAASCHANAGPLDPACAVPDTLAQVIQPGDSVPPVGGDSDKDGVADANDLCPGTGPNEPVDGSGCSHAQVGHDPATVLPAALADLLTSLTSLANPVAPGADGVWLRGDLHVHDDHSSDGSFARQTVGQGSPGTMSVGDQIAFAESQMLDFLPLNDHRTFDQHYDPQWKSSRLILITGEEANSRPHATVFGAVDMINQADNPSGVPEFRKLQQSIWDAHAQGAAWGTAHPDDGELENDGRTPNSFADATGPNLVEVWNRGTLISTKITYCENRWNAGYRFGIAGASDNHFKELWPVAGPGQPLTRVFARERTSAAIIEALRGGHTVISLNDRAPFVTLEGDFDNNPGYETVVGDEVRLAAGNSATLRVRVTNGVGTKVLVYRAPGKSAGAFKTFVPLLADQTFEFPVTADKDQDWYRVEVRGPGELDGADYGKTTDCGNNFPLGVTECRPQDSLDPDVPNQVRALTSPI
ncbi:MAG: CehA/McbA family metallohydrolase, partial [Nevskiales bacterium]